MWAPRAKTRAHAYAMHTLVRYHCFCFQIEHDKYYRTEADETPTSAKAPPFVSTIRSAKHKFARI